MHACMAFDRCRVVAVCLSLARPCDVFNAGAVPWEPTAHRRVAGGIPRDIPFLFSAFTVGEHNYLVLYNK